MKLRYKILNGTLVVVALAVLSLALIVSHDSPCAPAPALPAGATLMKGIVYRCYGSTDVLRLESIEKPGVADNRVLVKVRAASINPYDGHFMRGTPYIVRMDAGMGAPKEPRLGVDFAGTVEAVGKNVKRFKPGDEVFGGKNGSLAEFVSVREEGALALKPANMTFEQAAAVPVAALTALQGLRDEGRIRSGQKVLINGASGGVGTFAVQIAKSFGAEVTAVCSTRNVDLVRALGADHVIDYTREDFTKSGERYDLILDAVGNHSLSEFRRILNPQGVFVIVGGPGGGAWLGPLAQPIKAFIAAPFVSQKLVMVMAGLNTGDLEILRGLMESGKVTPVIDRRYPLSEVPAAMRYLEQGHARGKVVIDME